MKKIFIKHLTMTNFKCFRDKEVEFNGDITTISGRNGVGKTTIADAILFCLFGKNTAGQSDLELFKTRENGKVIPNVDHSVGLILTVSDGSAIEKEITLRRSIKEMWVKRRSTDEMVFKNNTCEYFVNNESYTKEDYKKYIDSLISEETFRTITSPTYFLTLHWKTQREFLTKMVGNINQTEVADTDQLKDFISQLGDEDVAAYRKHLSYQIKQVKDKLDKIPVRLEEQNKALPEKLDRLSIQAKAEHEDSLIKDIDEKIIAISSGHGDDVRRKELNTELDDMLRTKREMENTCRMRARQRQDEHDKRLSEASLEFNRLVSTQRDIEDSIRSFTAICERLRQQGDEKFAKEQAEIRSLWPQTQMQFSDEDGRCKVCGQILPPDMLEEARNKFNIRKAELKKTLTERAAKAKAELKKTAAEIEDFQSQKKDKEESLAATKEAINKAFSAKADIEKEHIITEEEELNGYTRFQQLLKEIDSLQKELSESDVDNDKDKQVLDDLKKTRLEHGNFLAECQKQLATCELYDYIQSLIEGINNEQKDLVAQLSELERKEDIASEYQSRENAILEERLNGLFSVVRWRLFRTVNNGGDPFEEPCCECLVGGIPYGGGLNQAARLNAGLDIINTLCQKCDVAAPIIIDNAESTINILATLGQQIRLQVADTDLQTL